MASDTTTQQPGTEDREYWIQRRICPDCKRQHATLIEARGCDHSVEAPAVTAPKVVCQYRRAKAMRAVIAGSPAWPDPADALAEAESWSPEHWAIVAVWASIKSPPSPDTIALTIELLREKAENS